MSFLKVLPFASKTTIIGDPSLSFFKFINMFVTPLTAPVGLPSEVVKGGIAWNALYKYDDPSIMKILSFMVKYNLVYYWFLFFIII